MSNIRLPQQVRLLSRRDVEGLLDLATCMDAVEAGFRSRAGGGQVTTGILGLPVGGGGFHAKAAGMVAGADSRFYFALKLNANFSENPARHDLPTIQGLLMLFDATSGTPLCVMDSIGITILRTAAATGVAARYLAVADARTATLVGCGAQGLAQLAAINLARPLGRVFVFDIDTARAVSFARSAEEMLRIPAQHVTDLRAATLKSEIIVTCTPARSAFLGERHVNPGAFVAAVGADSETKSEIEPELMAASAIVVDSLEQCATIGDLHQALARGVMRAEDVRADLASVIVDPSCGRRSSDEVVIFDSTGVALQDVAAAAVVYESAVRADIGTLFAFAG